MDILKKMFGLSGNEKDAATHNKGKEPSFGNEFRKPVWYDEESDDELFDNNKIFGFQVFTNPLEIQKYYEAQMQEMFKSMNELEANKGLFDENVREEYMKPGYENAIDKEQKQKKKPLDTDLDGEIYADQLHSLLQRITPEAHTMIALDALNKSRRAEKGNIVEVPAITVPARKLTDEEKIWNQIHGNANDEKIAGNNNKTAICRKFAQRVPQPHNNGAFEGVIGGPKTFRQGFTFEMVRKPGMSEMRRTVVDEEGNTKTVIRRTVDGKTETITTINGEAIGAGTIKGPKIGAAMPPHVGNVTLDCGRNLFVTKDGYVLPKNLW